MSMTGIFELMPNGSFAKDSMFGFSFQARTNPYMPPGQAAWISRLRFHVLLLERVYVPI